jgi:hypothetical protein
VVQSVNDLAAHLKITGSYILTMFLSKNKELEKQYSWTAAT